MMKNKKWLDKHVKTMQPENDSKELVEGYEAAREDVLQLLEQFNDMQYLDIKRKIEDLPLSVARSWVDKLNKLVGTD